jgi:1-acyl-sn-glycerol-3-phosphate acyltransferase
MIDPQPSREQAVSLERQARWSALISPLYSLFVWTALRFVFGVRLEGLAEFRRDLGRRLAEHRGPVIWTSNHLTHLDPWIIGWVLFPFSKVAGSWLGGKADRSLPWFIGEEAIHRPEGRSWPQRLLGWATYLGRALYVRRSGDDEAAAASRRTLPARASWALRRSGWLGFFPEGRRSRSGWFDPGSPKPLIGELAQAAPGSAILCLYLRGERQRTWTAFPRRSETFRLRHDWIEPKGGSDETPLELSRSVFERIGSLQEQWFAESLLHKNCGGFAVIDLRDSLASDFLEGARAEAARTAALAALRSAGLAEESDRGRIEVDLFRQKALHRPSGTEVDVRIVLEDGEKLACAAILRGGRFEDEASAGDLAWRVEPLPRRADPLAFARERLRSFIAESADDIVIEELEIGEQDGLPRVLRRGKVQDWAPSLSHSGAFVGFSFMVS